MSNLLQSRRETGAEVDLAPQAPHLQTAQTALLPSGETYGETLSDRFSDGLKMHIDLVNVLKICMNCV